MGTRADEYEHSREALQLATISVDGGDADRHLFAQNLSHTVAPFLRYDGRIGFSQWEHFGAVNDVKLRVVNPDGTQQVASPVARPAPASRATRSSRSRRSRRTSWSASAPRATAPSTPARSSRSTRATTPTRPASTAARTRTATTVGHACLDEENVDVHRPHAERPDRQRPVAGRPLPRAERAARRAHPHLLGRRPGQRHERAVAHPAGLRHLHLRPGDRAEPARLQRPHHLGPQRARRRRRAPSRPSSATAQHAQDSTIPVRIGSVNVAADRASTRRSAAPQFNNMPLGQALQQGAVAVRVIEGFSSEAAKGVTMFGLTMFEGAAVLGEAPVFTDGSWLANVPPYIPMHLQPIDKFGLAIRNQQLWIQGMPGEDRRCVGCHESRTGQGVPGLRPEPDRRRAARRPQDFTEADRRIAPSTPGTRRSSRSSTAKCASCHNAHDDRVLLHDAHRPGDRARRPRTRSRRSTSRARPVTVYYDRNVATWPGVVRLDLLPGDAGMMARRHGRRHRARVKRRPARCRPMWGVPGSARASALTQKLNLHGRRRHDGLAARARTRCTPRTRGSRRSPTTSARRSPSTRWTSAASTGRARTPGFVPFTSGDPVTPASRTEGMTRRNAMRTQQHSQARRGWLPLGRRDLRGHDARSARRRPVRSPRPAPASPASTGRSRPTRPSSSRPPTPSRAPR